MRPDERRDVLRGLIGRVDLDEFADRVLDSYWRRPELQGTRPSRDDARAWTRWNLDLLLRWLVDGQPPSDAELDVFRVRARIRAEDGTPGDFVPANFRRGARFGWNAALEVADERERTALLESADLLFEFVDRVSRIYGQAYEAADRSAPVATEERLARALVSRLCDDEQPLAEEIELAAEIGFRLEGVVHPFVIALPGPPGRQHAALAERLRKAGSLAISEGQWTVGLANHQLAVRALALPEAAAVAEGERTDRADVRRVLEELRMLISIAKSHGHDGNIEAKRYLPELLLRSAPSVAAQIRTHVYGPLRGHPELTQTLDMLIAHNFNRQNAADALPAHRNTVRDRLTRITELTGLDVEHANGRGLAWLAHLYASEPESSHEKF